MRHFTSNIISIGCKFMFAVILIGFHLPLTAQNKQVEIDSLKSLLPNIKDNQQKVDIYNKISNNYRDILPNEGIRFGIGALNLAERTGYKEGVARAYNNLGINYFFQGNYQKSLENQLLAFELFRELNDNRLVADVTGDIGLIYSSQGNYPKALEYYFQSLKIKEQSEFGKAKTLNNIGSLYQILNRYNEALEYYKKASSLFESIEDDLNLAGTYHNIGIVYFTIKEYAKAEQNFLKSLEVNQNIGNQQIIALNNNTLAGNYKALRNYSDAESYYLEALEMSKKIENKFLIATNYGDLGHLYLGMAKDESKSEKKAALEKRSIEQLKYALVIFQQLGDLNSYQKYSKLLSEAYALSGNFPKALEAFQEHSRYKDSIFNEEKTKEFTRREMDYEFAKKEDSIRLENEKEIAIRDATLAEKETQKWLYIGGLVLLTIIGVLLYYQNRLRKKKNEELDEANRVKDRFFSILNHDLRAPVSNLLQFLYLQKEEPEFFQGKNKSEMETKAIDSTENLLTTMEDLLLWSKGQMENFKPQPKDIEIEKIFQDINKLFSDKDNLNITYQNEQNLILHTDDNYLKTILRNLTSNAIKALADKEDAKIIWEAKINNGIVKLSIADNGPGGTSEQFRALYDEKEVVGIKTGLGLHLVRDMAKAIGCTVEVSTIKGEGTVISLCFGR